MKRLRARESGRWEARARNDMGMDRRPWGLAAAVIGAGAVAAGIALAGTPLPTPRPASAPAKAKPLAAPLPDKRPQASHSSSIVFAKPDAGAAPLNLHPSLSAPAAAAPTETVAAAP